MNPLIVSTTFPYRIGIWTANIEASGLIILKPDRTFKVHVTRYSDLSPFASDDIIAEILITAEARIEAKTRTILSGELDLSLIFELAGVTSRDPSWRNHPSCPLGWVNGLEESYHGVLVATNGILGITRTYDLQFKLHQMSHWTKRRSNRPSISNKEPAIQRVSRLDALLADL